MGVRVRDGRLEGAVRHRRVAVLVPGEQGDPVAEHVAAADTVRPGIVPVARDQILADPGHRLLQADAQLFEGGPALPVGADLHHQRLHRLPGESQAQLFGQAQVGPAAGRREQGGRIARHAAETGRAVHAEVDLAAPAEAEVEPVGELQGEPEVPAEPGVVAAELLAALDPGQAERGQVDLPAQGGVEQGQVQAGGHGQARQGPPGKGRVEGVGGHLGLRGQEAALPLFGPVRGQAEGEEQADAGGEVVGDAVREVQAGRHFGFVAHLVDVAVALALEAAVKGEHRHSGLHPGTVQGGEQGRVVEQGRGAGGVRGHGGGLAKGRGPLREQAVTRGQGLAGRAEGNEERQGNGHAAMKEWEWGEHGTTSRDGWTVSWLETIAAQPF